MSGSDPLWPRLRDLALDAARAGAAAAMPHFRRPALAVERKDDDSPVTLADRASEAAIAATIAAARPEDGWLGEESGGRPARSPYTWICDPIDGTRNFIRGIPLWAVLVACEHAEHGVVAAAVGLPALDEWYEALRGGGARCNGQRLQVSRSADLAEALFCYESPMWFARHGLEDAFRELCAASALQRGLGDAYGHMLVASGRAELVVEPQLALWDVAATSLVVSEAGGRFTDLAGRPNLRSGNAVVSNGLVHDAALAIIARHRRC
ncbi:MAG: inositol monophosphatase family protein [Planctomycetota bacterium]|nr:histidinol phosphate phosphatase [Planctomycetota bacterium]MDW8373212.1 inositol monophosphatase family protein [Planctomycetota bacterium]